MNYHEKHTPKTVGQKVHELRLESMFFGGFHSDMSELALKDF